MKIRHVTLTILVLFLVAFVAYLAGCDGGGDGDDDQAAGATSTIQGRVNEVVVTMRSGEAGPTMLSRLQDVLIFLRTAHAQGNNGVSNITVIAEQNGEQVDTDVTDDNGQFTVEVGTGDITLVFETPNFTVSAAVTAPANSVITLSVTLQADEVIVDTMDVANNDADDDADDDDNDIGFNPPADHTDEEDGVLHKPGKDTPFSNGCTDCHGSELTGSIAAPSCFTCHGEVWN